MTQGVLYIVDGEELKRMRPSAPDSEDRMQYLVARYPELITDGDGDLLLISRESAIGDGESAGRWSLDHLFVTRDAVPVLVELKRASDTRIKREVIGQLIDYAANASAHWISGTVAASFAKTVGLDRADVELAAFIGDRDPEEFWTQVDTNLKAGRMKLVFVADVISRELAIVVEFLNAQMRADVRAIELRWFSDESGLTTLSPRVIGQTEQAASAKSVGRRPPMDLAQWIDERIAPLGPAMLTGVQRFCALADAAGGQCLVPSTRGSIIVQWDTEDRKHVYPVGVYPSGMVVLRLGYLKFRPAFAGEHQRLQLYDALSAIVGPLHTKSLAGEPGFSAVTLNDDEIAARYAEFLSGIVERGQRG